MRNWIFAFFVLFSTLSFSQELNCVVKVNYDQVTNANVQIFKTLERQLNEFVNNTKWTEKSVSQNEKIDCSMFITINAYESNAFSGSIQVQSSRNVYNSTYTSPVFNHNDKEFDFRYVEFENLLYNPNGYDSNLVAVIAFYANIIIGIDADTFAKNGGTKYFEAASNIANLAQSSNAKGWTQSEKTQNRYYLINDLLSNTYSAYRETMYQYHYLAMDKMADNTKAAKEGILSAVMNMSKIHSVRPNSFISRVFFDAKSDEIVSIFSGGPNVNIADLVDTLNKVSPLNTSKWSSIKF